MKLAFLSPTYPYRGGIARYGSYLLGTLQQRHECLGIGFKKLYPPLLFPGKGELELGQLPAAGSEAQPMLHYARPSTWRRAFHEIKEFSPDCVLLTWWVSFWAPHMGWMASRLAPSFPVFFLCHNVLPHEARFFDPALTRWALKRGRGFIVHSDENRRQLSEWFPRARVIRAEHPVYFSDANFALSREEARERLGVSGRMLLFFGFVRPYKGLDIAIEALARLGPDLKDIMLWVTGEFWEGEERYRNLVEKHKLQNRVRIESGYLSDADLAQRICACDGVVLPYRAATGSGALATAYAFNRPVIATCSGCLANMVVHGESGLLCEPGSVSSLAEAIIEFYSGDGSERFHPGVEKIKKRFTWDKIVDSVEELLKNE